MSAPADRNPAVVLTAAFAVYSLVAAAALLWLSARDRLDVLPKLALGERGLLFAAGSGLAVGLAAAAALAWAARRFSSVRRCEDEAASAIGGLPDGAMVAFALLAAVAEELLFRVAVQDALGVIAAVACYGAVNTGPRRWVWLPIALVLAAAFSALLALGCGLLSAAIAHALVNYLSLRRILPT